METRGDGMRIKHDGAVDEAFDAIDRHSLSNDFGPIAGVLDEAHSIHTGRTPAEIGWIRGYALVTLARHEVPPETIPYLLEQLETGHDAYVVACAASTLRAVPPSPGFSSYLQRALLAIRQRDRILDLDERRGIPGRGNDTTAVDELLLTALHLGQVDPGIAPMLEQLIENEELGLSAAFKNRLQRTHARIAPPKEPVSCCADTERWRGLLQLVQANFRTDSLGDLALEDQEGHECTFGDFLAGCPAVVTFFYTRCDNAGKCSLTVSRLAELQRMLATSGLADRVCLAAFTYDTSYDGPSRLLAYGKNRGFTFGTRARFFRVKGDFSRLKKIFALGVNFAGSIVNHHRIELFILGRNGQPQGTLQRLQWNPSEIIPTLERELAPPTSPLLRFANGLGNFCRTLPGLLPCVAMALLPKCPLCFAAWASAFGFGWMASSPRAFDWLNLLLAGMIVAYALWTARCAWRSKRWAALWAWLAGYALVLAGVLAESMVLSMIGIFGAGIAGTITASGSLGSGTPKSSFYIERIIQPSHPQSEPTNTNPTTTI